MAVGTPGTILLRVYAFAPADHLIKRTFAGRAWTAIGIAVVDQAMNVFTQQIGVGLIPQDLQR
jgi:hypothetical protein